MTERINAEKLEITVSNQELESLKCHENNQVYLLQFISLTPKLNESMLTRSSAH